MIAYNPYMHMDYADKIANSNFRRQVIRTYGFPIVMFALAIVPGPNFFMYSGHGGIGWFIVPLCFPYVVVRALIKILGGTEESRTWYRRFFKITLPCYMVAAVPLSWAAAMSIRMTFGLPISGWAFFALMVSPVPWWYFT